MSSAVGKIDRVFRNMANRVGIMEKAFKDDILAPCCRTKLMVVGESKVGKTSTINSLLHKKFNPIEQPTKGYEMKHVEAPTWKACRKNHLVKHLEGIISSGQSENESFGTSSSQNSNISIVNEELEEYNSQLDISMGKEVKMSFSIWDFSGLKMFYALHHLFLSEFGCYLLVFNVNDILNETSQKEALEYIQFWLFSKKLHAPLAPVILVGTHAGNVTNEEIAQVDEILAREALESNDFGEIYHNNLSFVAIDNKYGSNIDELRGLIEKTTADADYFNEMIPLSYLRVHDRLSKLEKGYLKLERVDSIVKECGLSEEQFHSALLFLSRRGFISHFGENESMREYMVINPQWLISAITEVIFHRTEHSAPEFDPKYRRDYRKFCYQKILSKDLLTDIWTKRGFSEDEQKFLKKFLLRSALMCNYKFDGRDEFLLPSLFSGESDQNLDKNGYSGPFGVIDFSGNYDEEIVQDSGQSFVRYLPFGFFERIVCLAIEMSCLYENSVKPQIGDQWARLSFGVYIDFELSVCNDLEGKPRWIKIKSDKDTKMSEVRGLIKKGYSMIKGLREDFFAKKEGASYLAISLLVPSSASSGHVLAKYNLLLEDFTKGKENVSGKVIRPSHVNKKKIEVASFSEWFQATSDNTNAAQDVLTNPDEGFGKQTSNVPAHIEKQLPLPGNSRFHCFLSYKQKSAIDMVGKQYYILSEKGYRCWYDQQLRGELNLQAMQDGVRDSMCYMLFLSKDIFPSPYVEEEVKMAVKLNKPIILLHHPDTGSVGYWRFSDYISKAPEVLKPFFVSVESIQLQRRHYLEEAVTHVIDERLRKIYADLTAKAEPE